MVVTISNNTITTMIEGVAEGVAYEVVGVAIEQVVEEEIIVISRNHHQVHSYVCHKCMYTFHTV